MFQIPDPLHPALVHFPIALILVGTLAALVAVSGRWPAWTWISAGLLTLGALGAMAAAYTGDEAKELLGSLPAATKDLLHHHEEWADKTVWLASLAALAGWGSVALQRQSSPRARWARGLAVVLALSAAFGVYQTARRGGEMVYHHGVGVKIDGALAAPADKDSDND